MCKHNHDNCECCSIDFDGEDCPFLKITRPPQSYYYVEELESEQNV